MNDDRGQRNENICKDVCSYDIVSLISDFILYFNVIDDVSDHHIKRIIFNLVCFFVILYSRNCTWIKVCSDNMSCTEFKCCDSKDSASCSYIEDLCAAGHIFLELTDHELCCLVHTGSKCCTRVNVKDHFVLIFFFDFFPGWNDQDIIYIELMEKFFPVVDPVLIFCLGFFDRAFSDVHESTQFFQCVSYITKNALLVGIFFQIKIQICDPVICRSVWKNIDKHLLFVLLRQRYFIFNLYAFHAGFCQCGDHDIFYF